MDKKSILVNYEIKEGRLFVDLSYPENQDTPYVEMLNALIASLSMTIRVVKDKGYNEGEVFGGVMDWLEKEFINLESFKDLKVYR